MGLLIKIHLWFCGGLDQKFWPPLTDTALDAEVARKMNEKEWKEHGLPPFAEVQKTKSGRDSRQPDRFQTGGARARNAPTEKE